MKKLGTPKAVRNFFASSSGESRTFDQNFAQLNLFLVTVPFLKPTTEDGGNRRGEIGEFKEEFIACCVLFQSGLAMTAVLKELNHNNKDRKKEALKKAGVSEHCLFLLPFLPSLVPMVADLNFGCVFAGYSSDDFRQ